MEEWDQKAAQFRPVESTEASPLGPHQIQLEKVSNSLENADQTDNKLRSGSPEALFNSIKGSPFGCW